MKKNFLVGFWNYVPAGKIDAEESASDWADLGMGLAMSCECDGEKDRAYILQNLDAAAKRGIKVIVCDSRTRWKNYVAKGAETFEKEVKTAAADYAAHPAFYAFHVGDEPGKEDWAHMLAAAKIVRRHARPFVNFFPFFEEDFIERVGVTHGGYEEKLSKAVQEIGLDMLCYDCYTQCYEHSREEGIDSYFYNLNRFYSAAKRGGADMWTTLLFVGHWSFRVPSEDDLRWQISTAAAHGAKGLLWFYVYGRLLESSYRQSPFDQYYQKTATFGALARQNKLFRDHFAEKLSNAELLDVWHVGKSYGGTPLYTPGCIEGLSFTRKYEGPMIVSRFQEEGGGTFLLFVNNSQNDIQRIEGYYGGQAFGNWFAPGQMVIVQK